MVLALGALCMYTMHEVKHDDTDGEKKIICRLATQCTSELAADAQIRNGMYESFWKHKYV